MLFVVLLQKLAVDAWICHWSVFYLNFAIFNSEICFPWVKMIISGLSSSALVFWTVIDEVNFSTDTMLIGIVIAICLGLYKQTTRCLLLAKPRLDSSLLRSLSFVLRKMTKVKIGAATLAIIMTTYVIGGSLRMWTACLLVGTFVDLPSAELVSELKAKCQFKVDPANLQ